MSRLTELLVGAAFQSVMGSLRSLKESKFTLISFFHKLKFVILVSVFQKLKLATLISFFSYGKKLIRVTFCDSL